MTHTGRYFISAGELSGDNIAADFVKNLKEQEPGYRASGLTGPKMEEAGVDSVMRFEKFSVMGISEVALKLFEILKSERILVQKIRELKPDFVILVDFPGLHLRIAEKLAPLNIPVFHFVAPKIWAWGEKRIPRIKKYYKLVFGILPFEKEFYEQSGIQYEYVGSPWLEWTQKAIDLGFEHKTVALLPGSRKSEAKKLWPELMSVKRALESSRPDLNFVVPLASSITQDFLEGMGREDNIRYIEGKTLDVLKSSDIAVLASGTVSLECALVNTPQVVVYKMGWLTYFIVKMKVKVKFASLVNLILDEELVPEYLQQNVKTHKIVNEICRLLDDPSKQLKGYEKMREKMKPDAGKNAAKSVLNYLRKHSSDL